jgi:hypothetical protein
VPAFWYAGKPIQFGVGLVIGTVWRYALASLLAGVACAWIVSTIHLPFASDATAAAAFARIVTDSVLLFTLYIGAVVGLHGGWEPLRQIARLLPDLMPGRRPVFESPQEELATVGASGGESID